MFLFRSAKLQKHIQNGVIKNLSAAPFKQGATGLKPKGICDSKKLLSYSKL